MAKDQKPKTKSQFEHSAGGVIFQKVNGAVKILLIQDKNNQWTFPKGLIDEAEAAQEAAEREILEEVGLSNLTFAGEVAISRYFYRFEGNLVRKRVDYFLFAYSGNVKPTPQADEGIQSAEWFTQEKALEKIGYRKTNNPVLKKAIKIIHTS